MLTKNHFPKNHDIAGTDNQELWEIFNTLFGDGATHGYFEEIQHYFVSKGFGTYVFNERNFSQSGRKDYFDLVHAQLPKNSLIFLDPDTGLKEDGATEKHLRYSELMGIYTKMDDNSILMIYQYHNRYRTKDQNFSESITDKVQQSTGASPLVINDNTIMFLFLAKNTQLNEKLKGILNDYRKKYSQSFDK